MATAVDNLGDSASASINLTVESLTSFWSMTGNSQMNPDSNFVGTVDRKPLVFRTNNTERARFDSVSGILYIGGKLLPTSADSITKLAVKGGIHAQKVKVSVTDWPDYVFDGRYKLRSLPSTEAYIREHRHLPDIPSEQKMTSDGLDIGSGQALLLQKIEELTLYLIKQQKEIDELKRQLKRQKSAPRRIKKNNH
jgi:hypothetical protein